MFDQPMLGRDLIIYILEHGLENEPVVKDGSFIGFMTVEKFAVLNEVGTETVKVWIDMGLVKSVKLGETYYVLA